MTTSSCVKIVLAWEKAQLETKCLKEVMEMPCNEYLPVCAQITGAFFSTFYAPVKPSSTNLKLIVNLTTVVLLYRCKTALHD